MNPAVFGGTSPRVRRTCLTLVGAGLVLLIGVGGALALWGRSWVESMVRKAALEHGVELTWQGMDLGWKQLVLRDVGVRLRRVSAVEMRARTLTLTLDGFRPNRAELDQLQVGVVGSAALMAVDLSEWTRAHVSAFRGGIVARGVTLNWREEPSSDPWLVLTQGTVIPKAQGGELRALEGRVLGIPVGQVSTQWTQRDAEIELGFGIVAAQGEAPVRLLVHHQDAQPSAEITLRPVALDRMSGPLGVALPVRDVTVRAQASLLLPPQIQAGPVNGHLSLVLTGYVPPHPPELNGFVFGNETQFDTDFSLTADRKHVDLTQSRVTAGAFVLKGQGTLDREAAQARIRLGLNGAIPCSALTTAVAESRLGRTLGGLLGQAAQGWVGGSVSVNVKIDADTRDLSKAKVQPTIGIGCGLRPLGLPASGVLGDMLNQLPRALPRMPNELLPGLTKPHD